MNIVKQVPDFNFQVRSEVSAYATQNDTSPSYHLWSKCSVIYYFYVRSL